jgi:phage shock protein A
MGIFKRIKSIVTAQTNGFLDQVEEPIYMLNQYVREAEEDLAKGQQALATQFFLEKKQAILIAQTEQILAKRERQAKLAVERGEEEMAKIALQEKIIQEEKLKAFAAQYDSIKAQTVDLTNQLKQLQEKLDEFKHRKLLLTSKVNVATSLKKINDTFVSFDSDNIARGFARVEERILLLESELEARQQLASINHLKTGLNVDAALQEKVEQELEKLKGFAAPSA